MGQVSEWNNWVCQNKLATSGLKLHKWAKNSMPTFFWKNWKRGCQIEQHEGNLDYLLVSFQRSKNFGQPREQNCQRCQQKGPRTKILDFVQFLIRQRVYTRYTRVVWNIHTVSVSSGSMEWDSSGVSEEFSHSCLFGKWKNRRQIRSYGEKGVSCS